MTNGTELQRGTWRLERDDDGHEGQVEDHSGRDGHGTISPRPQEPQP
jgi:hypothetical protein